jgi:hypothetical protein
VSDSLLWANSEMGGGVSGTGINFSVFQYI